MKSFVSALAVVALAGSALAQSPYGSIQFRWRERALGVLPVAGGAQTTVLNASATGLAGAALDQAGSLTTGVSANDARFQLVLEARVTRAAGNTDLQGLFGFAGSVVASDSRSQSSFAANAIGAGADNIRNASSTTATAYNAYGAYTPLPAGAIALPGEIAGARGIFGPFRNVADIGGNNQPAIGVRNRSTASVGNPALQNNASLEQVVFGGQLDAWSFQTDVNGDGSEFADGPYTGRSDFWGLDSWVPLYATTLNIADVATVRDIVVSFNVAGTSATDSGLRGWRAAPSRDAGTGQFTAGQIFNPANNVNSWQLDNGGLPSFVISVVPTPGAAALLGLGGLVAARRRRA